MTQESGRPTGGELDIYISADERTRNLIEAQIRHAHWWTRHQCYLQWVGLILGFFVTMAFLAAAVFLIERGHDVSGTILGTVDIVALVTVFVLGRRMEVSHPANLLHVELARLGAVSKDGSS